MKASIDRIEDGIYRISVHVPEIAPPAGFSFSSFLIDDHEPLLFHAGRRDMFAAFSAGVASIMPIERLRWISFGHVEADECGAMNLWLAAAPQSEVVHGATACDTSLNDLADRRPRVVADGELITNGHRRLRFVSTPHVPHGWESGVLFEETSGTLFCGDLFTQLGSLAMSDGDPVPGAIAAEEMFHATSVGSATAPTLRRLAALRPTRLALMHGPVYRCHGEDALLRLADYYASAMRSAECPAPEMTT